MHNVTITAIVINLIRCKSFLGLGRDLQILLWLCGHRMLCWGREARAPIHFWILSGNMSGPSLPGSGMSRISGPRFWESKYPNLYMSYCPCEEGLVCHGDSVDVHGSQHVHHNPKCLPAAEVSTAQVQNTPSSTLPPSNPEVISAGFKF